MSLTLAQIMRNSAPEGITREECIKNLSSHLIAVDPETDILHNFDLDLLRPVALCGLGDCRRLLTTNKELKR